MAIDPVLLERVTRRLVALADSTPKGAGFWETLATAAVTEASKVVAVGTRPLPTTGLRIALVPFGRPPAEGFRLLAHADTLAELQPYADTYLTSAGEGEVWLVELKRICTATSA